MITRRAALGLLLAGAASAQYQTPRLRAMLEDAAVSESSGITASRRHPGLYWTHNDSGGGPFLYLFDDKGKSKGTWRVRGAQAVDWEDIAAGPGPVPGRHYLYVGDIGDNERRRSEVVVYRVEEPPLEGKRDIIATAIRVHYPDAPHDAEALLVHPASGDLYIVTKARGEDTETGVYKAPAPLQPSMVLRKLASLHFPEESDVTLALGRVTGGDISPDGTRVVLCDYFRAYEAVLPAGRVSLDAVWRQTWRAVPIGQRRQGEGVCYRLDGKALLATSEGQPCPLWEVIRQE